MTAFFPVIYFDVAASLFLCQWSLDKEFSLSTLFISLYFFSSGCSEDHLFVLVSNNFIIKSIEASVSVLVVRCWRKPNFIRKSGLFWFPILGIHSLRLDKHHWFSLSLLGWGSWYCNPGMAQRTIWWQRAAAHACVSLSLPFFLWSLIQSWALYSNVPIQRPVYK